MLQKRCWLQIVTLWRKLGPTPAARGLTRWAERQQAIYQDDRNGSHSKLLMDGRQRAFFQGQLDKLQRRAATEAKAARVRHSQDLAQNAALLAQLNALRKVMMHQLNDRAVMA